MKILLQSIVRVSVAILGFACFLSVPYLFLVVDVSYSLSFGQWYNQSSSVLGQLFDFQFQNFSDWFQESTRERYVYTMGLFLCSICLVMVCSIFLTYLYYLTSPKVKKHIRRLLSFSESIPDLLVILLFISFVIFLYKTTGLKFLQLYGFNTEPITIPILVISYLPIAFLTEYFIQQIDEEKEKDYVILAKAKGLTLRVIFFKHILKNMLPLCIPYIRKIVFIILSNIVLIEYLLKIQGFTQDLFRIFQTHPFIMAFYFTLFALPIILLELASRLYSHRTKGVSSL